MNSEQKDRFTVKEGWMTWFKILLGFIIAYQVFTCIGSLFFAEDLGSYGTLEWVAIIIAYLRPVAIILGAIGTLLMNKFSFYLLMIAEFLGALSVFGIFIGGFTVLSFIGALIADLWLPVLLLVSVKFGFASTTGKNPFKTVY